MNLYRVNVSQEKDFESLADIVISCLPASTIINVTMQDNVEKMTAALMAKSSNGTTCDYISSRMSIINVDNPENSKIIIAN